MRGRQVEIPSSTSPMLKTRSALGVEHIRQSDAVCECSCLAGLTADLRLGTAAASSPSMLPKATALSAVMRRQGRSGCQAGHA